MRELAVGIIHIKNGAVLNAFGQIMSKFFYVFDYGIVDVAITLELLDIAINRIVKGGRISKNISYGFCIILSPINSIEDSQKLINCSLELSNFKLRCDCAKSRNMVSKETERIVISKAAICKSLCVRSKRVDYAVDICLVKIYVKHRTEIVVKVCINCISVKESVKPLLIIYALSKLQKLFKRIRSCLINNFAACHAEKRKNLILKLVANFARFGKLQERVAYYTGNVNGYAKVVAAKSYVNNLSYSASCLLNYLRVTKKSERKRKINVTESSLHSNFSANKILDLLSSHISNFIGTGQNA